MPVTNYMWDEVNDTVLMEAETVSAQCMRRACRERPARNAEERRMG